MDLFILTLAIRKLCLAQMKMANMLNIGNEESPKEEVIKKLLPLKPARENGLLLNIQHNSSKKHVRIVICDFHCSGNVIALATNEGQIHIINFLLTKFWALPQIERCTCLKFSKRAELELLISKNDGSIKVVNANSGNEVVNLIYHKYPVATISIADSNICVSASKHEAVIWDLKNYVKLQVLALADNCVLKFVHFIPVSNHILACFQDDVIQIWRSDTFSSLKQFSPSNWHNYSVKSVSLSRNGRIMVVGGYLPIIAIFLLDVWKLLKVVHLPDYIKTVKEVHLIPRDFDGGSNKLLIILSGKGVIYFYDMQKNLIASELRSKCEIVGVKICENKAHYLACLLSSGEVEIYDITQYVTESEGTVIERVHQSSSKIKLRTLSKSSIREVKYQINEVLQVDKIKSVIREYQQIPDVYRTVLWEKILELPNNRKLYSTIANNVSIVAFKDLYSKFPLEDAALVKCLKNLLNNIVTWCPFFATVNYLPVLLFPFVKVFHKSPVICFELCCTIIINWCQHWFEYHPLLPMNVLAMIDNLFIEYDPDLLKHFREITLPSSVYSWSLLETAFSEALTASEWVRFWDQVLINEPAFLICAVVAYNVLQRKALMRLNLHDLVNFYHTLKPVDVRKLISKTYHILNNTSERMHPRQYLKPFRRLSRDTYPDFQEYPRTTADLQMGHLNYLNREYEKLHKERDLLMGQARMANSEGSSHVEVQEEQKKRLREVEKACLENIKSYQENLKKQQENLLEMRQELLHQEKEMIDDTSQRGQQFMLQRQMDEARLLLDKLQINDNLNQIEFMKVKDRFLQKNLDMLRQKQDLLDLPAGDKANANIASHVALFQNEAMKMRNELEKAKVQLNKSPTNFNVLSGISAIDKIIDKIKNELATDDLRMEKRNECVSKVKGLEIETRALQRDVSRLLKVLADNHKKNTFNNG
ncbi:TBC1 domain family member 31 [Cylas formicarius]|uniref:TBC1 domain family member 31 n=1 Tax=Cylas formicarius TaxID=197179 RepID=UPI00295846FA|nr:TBC1 domain family member 31 [Cylas formicarius]XP_060536486.1 TBC1 domain family member 31 [Cylas formicarius]